MREAVAESLRQLDSLKELVHPAAGLGRRSGLAVHDQGLGDALGNREQRIEARCRVLEDEADPAADGPELPLPHAVHLDAVHHQGAAADLRQPGDRAADGGLPTPGLTHQPEYLAGTDAEVDAVHRHEIGLAEPARVDDPQVLRLNHGRLFGPVRCSTRRTVTRASQTLADAGDGCQQLLRVRLSRGGEQRPHVGLLHDPSLEHHGHAVRQVGHHAHVVGDEHDGGAELVAAASQQVEDLGLDGDVERGGGFVGDDHARVQHQGLGDDDALLLAAGELVGVVVHPHLGVGDAHPAQDVDGLGSCLGLRVLAVRPEPLNDLPADGVDGVEGGGGFLEHHGGVPAAQVAELCPRHLEDVVLVRAVLVPEYHRATGARGLGQQAEDGLGGHGLAAARLPDDGEHFTGMDGQGDPIHGDDGAGVGGEGDPQVLDVHDVGHRVTPPSGG